MTGELKKLCIQEIQKVVASFQEKKKAVTDETVKYFMDGSRKIDPSY